jgi:hypothetical protein
MSSTSATVLALLRWARQRQEARDKFWSVYQDSERLLEAGRKAEALDAVCGLQALHRHAWIE